MILIVSPKVAQKAEMGGIEMDFKQQFELMIEFEGVATLQKLLHSHDMNGDELWSKDFGVLKSSAQITKRYSKSDLLGRQIIGVINFPPKQIANFKSEFLVTGFILGNGDVVLAEPQRKVPNGSRLA